MPQCTRRDVLAAGGALIGAGAARSLVIGGGALLASMAPPLCSAEPVVSWGVWIDKRFVGLAREATGGMLRFNEPVTTTGGQPPLGIETLPLDLAMYGAYSREQLKWLQAALQATTIPPRAIDLSGLSYDSREVFRQRFDQLWPTGFRTGSFHKEQAGRVDFDFTYAGTPVARKAGSGVTITAATTLPRPKNFPRDRFRFFIQGLESVAAGTLGLNGIEVRNLGGAWRYTPLDVRISLSHAAPVYAWFDDVAAGRSGPRAGVLQCLGDNDSNLVNFSIASMRPLGVTPPARNGEVALTLQISGLQIDAPGLDG